MSSSDQARIALREQCEPRRCEERDDQREGKYQKNTHASRLPSRSSHLRGSHWHLSAGFTRESYQTRTKPNNVLPKSAPHCFPITCRLPTDGRDRIKRVSQVFCQTGSEVQSVSLDDSGLPQLLAIRDRSIAADLNRSRQDCSSLVVAQQP